jgi:twitching motility protein PilT
MQTFDQHLLQHLHAGRVTMDDAMRVATSPHDFKLMVAASAKPAGNDGPEATVSAPVEHVSEGAPSYEATSPPPPPPAAPSAPPSPSAPPPGVPY